MEDGFEIVQRKRRGRNALIRSVSEVAPVFALAPGDLPAPVPAPPEELPVPVPVAPEELPILLPEELPTPEYMILTEEELQIQSNRMNWRKGNTDTVADLFRVQHDRPEFPTIFQNYRPYSEIKKPTPFTKIKPLSFLENSLSFLEKSLAKTQNL